MRGSVFSGLVIFSALVASTSALRVPVRRRSFERSRSHSMSTGKRHTSNPDLHALSGYENFIDERYVGNITIGGHSFEARLTRS